MSRNNKKKNNNNLQQFEFCEVCKSNHNQGRRHNFFPSHKASLSTLLARFQSKIADVKFFLKTPMAIRPEHAHQNRLWCIFCNCDILELDSPFACGNTIQHLASVEHWKRVKGFMWKHGGGMDPVHLFRISEVDYAKWEKNCKTLKTEEASKAAPMGPVVGPSKNIHNELNADSVNSFQTNDINSHNICITNGVVPLHSYTNERTQVSCSVSSVSDAGSSSRNMPGSIKLHAQYSPGYMDNQYHSNPPAIECSSYGYLSTVCSGVRKANGDSISPGIFSTPGSMKLTQISSTPKQDIQGNVHSGAPPPWLDATLQPKECDLISSKARKPSKLNLKRVGAAWAERRKVELELEKRGELVNNNYDANWLPDFGRVWQSGTRKESRKEFKMESTSPKADDEKSEMLMPLQPYISKRMRREMSG